MNVLCIGNAIVDILSEVNDKFLLDRGMEKGSMHMITKNQSDTLISILENNKKSCGGSASNTATGLSSLGCEVSFIGKVSNDKLGNEYETSLTDQQVKYCYNKKLEDIPTGTCLILITPDSERTMCTFLGIAGQIAPNDIDENFIKQSELIFLEGFLWDEGDPKAAFNKALKLANKSAMSLSDKFCVDRHKKSFYNLVKNKLDITFANEQEIRELIDAKTFDDVIEFGKDLNKLLVITRSDKGSVAISGSEIVECESQKNLKIVDLTGAGDLFAAGFLHGYINSMSTKESLQQGTKMASKIIQKIGARLD